MKILYVPKSLASINEYIDNAQPVIKCNLYSHLIDEQANLFNFVYKGCENLQSSLLPSKEPTQLFKTMFKYVDDNSALVETSTPHAVLIALNKVENGKVVSLPVLYGEEFNPEDKFVWVFKEKRDETNFKFLTVTIEPAKPNQIQNGFVLTDEVTARRIFCAEYLTKLRTMTRVSNGENDTLTYLFTENQTLTALYACHLLQ